MKVLNQIRKKQLKILKNVFYKSVLELIFTPVPYPREPPTIFSKKHHNRCTLIFISDLVGLCLAEGTAELCEAGEAAQESVRLLLLIRDNALNQESRNKGTVSWDRFQEFLQKFTELGLNFWGAQMIT